MVQGLETAFARALPASSSAVTIAEFLDGVEAQRERVRVGVEAETPQRPPDGPIGRSRVATLGALDGPSGPAVFGR